MLRQAMNWMNQDFLDYQNDLEFYFERKAEYDKQKAKNFKQNLRLRQQILLPAWPLKFTIYVMFSPLQRKK